MSRPIKFVMLVDNCKITTAPGKVSCYDLKEIFIMSDRVSSWEEDTSIRGILLEKYPESNAGHWMKKQPGDKKLTRVYSSSGYNILTVTDSPEEVAKKLGAGEKELLKG
jgi:hypothetical protein